MYLVGWVLIPKIMRQNVTSGYELLETRLGVQGRMIGAVMFFKDLTQVEMAEENENLKDRLLLLGQMAFARGHCIGNCRQIMPVWHIGPDGFPGPAFLTPQCRGVEWRIGPGADPGPGYHGPRVAKLGSGRR